LLLGGDEECRPEDVDPGMGYHAIASAMLLSTESHHQTLGQCSRPRVVDQPIEVEARLATLIDGVPLFALTPLFRALKVLGNERIIPISFQSQYWVVDCMTAKHPKPNQSSQ